jgi:glutaredoxin
MEFKKRETTKLYVFTSPTCHPCHKALNDLKKHNIIFEEVDVNKNAELVKKYSIRHAPTFVGLDSKGSAHCLIGYQNIKYIKEIFNI